MYKLLTIGFSAGGIPLIKRILKALPKHYPLPIAIVAHMSGGDASNFAEMLDASSILPVKIATDKEMILPAWVYLAPPDYHLLVEQSHHTTPFFSLSVDEPVRSVRPSIDVLFESAAEVFESGLIALLLSGANSDGMDGMAYVKKLGGLGIVLDPKECEFNTMTEAAIKKVEVDYVVNMEEIIGLLLSVHETT